MAVYHSKGLKTPDMVITMIICLVNFKTMAPARFFPIYWKLFLRGIAFCGLYIASDTVVIVWKNQGDARIP